MARRVLNMAAKRHRRLMTTFSSLRARLVGTVFVAITPAWALMYYTHLPWAGFIVGLIALGAAWFGGERFILRQVRTLCNAASQLAAGNLATRTGLAKERGELGELARTIDAMAAALEERATDRERAEKGLLARALQQTVVSALGQFALVSKDFQAVLNQAVVMVSQTLEVEYCSVLELQPDKKVLLLQAGIGWRDGMVGALTVPAEPTNQAGYTLGMGEPVVVEKLSEENRFAGSQMLLSHGVVSGITVAISGQGQAYGVLGAHTTNQRKFTEDEVHFLLAVATVLAMAAARNRAEADIQKLAAFAQLNPNPAMELVSDGSISYCNEAGRKAARSLGLDSPRALLPENIGEIVRGCLESHHGAQTLETRVAGRVLSWAFHPVPSSAVVHAYAADITDRLSLEAQLRQSQKMESVGQLAAGVAHDFNNMLTIIQGHAGLLLANTALPPGLADSTQAIYFAAERASSLTRQLLMFSRKNVMQPKLLDLREVVANMSKMLQRLLGEHIIMEFNPPAEIPLVQADTGMMEQVIMNLAVNARDAMPRGGRLQIATSSAEVKAAYVKAHPEARPGMFVCLEVMDSGCGMDAATMARIFEPFFTTKEVGKGTGLGLATVYGIVKQHEGWIEVSSEPAHGARFSVYLPASGAAVQARPTPANVPIPVRGGRETILVVEDEPVLRDMAHMILKDCGYQILEASSGVEALKVWERYRDNIDLVLTDMVMPEGISGMDLAQRLHGSRPDLKIIFASGYSMDDIDTQFVRKGHAAFLQKPYTHVSLAKAVRDCLDGAPVSA
jgi:signal transduction histidine kinase/ActR/RegA family two-component response regulator/HAMP domain-containing protein